MRCEAFWKKDMNLSWHDVFETDYYLPEEGA
jgi:hypothetical protein